MTDRTTVVQAARQAARDLNAAVSRRIEWLEYDRERDLHPFPTSNN